MFIVTRASIPDGIDVTLRFALPIDGRVVSEAAKVRWARLAAVVLAVNATTRRQARCATRPVAARSPHTERSPVRRAAKRMLVLAHAQHKHTPTER